MRRRWSPEEWEQKKKCPACGEEIPLPARVCSKCQTKLGGLLRYVHLFSPLLGFLIALITFVGLFIPIIVENSGLADSVFDFAFKWSGEKGIHLLVRNKGSRPGVIGKYLLKGDAEFGKNCNQLSSFIGPNHPYDVVQARSENRIFRPYPDGYRDLAKFCPGGTCKLFVQVKRFKAEDFSDELIWEGSCNEIRAWKGGGLK